MFKLIPILFLAVACFFVYKLCDTGMGQRALEKAGYTHVEMDDAPVLLTCGQSSFGHHFKAKSPKGDETTGLVCCGLFNCGVEL